MALTEMSKVSLVSVTKKYGVIESQIQPGFEDDTNKVEGKYILENLPHEVTDVCREIQSVRGRALLVGGSVRDMIISHHTDADLVPKDFDLEVYGLSSDDLYSLMIDLFGAENVITAGRDFGVIKIRIKGWKEYLDISISRTDSKQGEGHRGIVVTEVPDILIREAAKRRDITINSITYDPLNKTVYDPFGGIKDIKNKIIRMTNEVTFQEDPLRVIRLIQLAARLGFRIERKTERVCKRMVKRGEMVARRNEPEKMEYIDEEITKPPEKIQEDGKQFFVVEGQNFVTGRRLVKRGNKNVFVKEYTRPKTIGTKRVKEEEAGKFLVVEGGKIFYRKLVKASEPLGLPQERVAEELYKLLLKGKKPSLGLEFAQKIGLIRLYWPALDALKGIKQEKKWHPEKDAWDHVMQAVDAMAEIAHRELEEGKIPTPEMWQEMERQVERFVAAKQSEIELELYKTEYVTLGKQDELEAIVFRAREVALEMGKTHRKNTYRRMWIQAMGNARTEFGANRWKTMTEAEVEVYKIKAEEDRQKILNDLISEKRNAQISVGEMKELKKKAKKMRLEAEREKNRPIVFARAKEMFADMINKDKHRREEEINSIIKGTEEKEIRAQIRSKIAGLVLSGRQMEIEEEARGIALSLGDEYRKKRSISLKDDVVIALVLVALCHDLGKATTTTIDKAGEIHSYGHEQAGVSPMRQIASTLFETRFSKEIKRMLYPLIANHMRPTEFWKKAEGVESNEGTKIDAEEEKWSAKKAMRRLAHRLANGDGGVKLDGSTDEPVYPDGGGADLYLLGLLAIVDQCARNSLGTPFTIEEMNRENKLEWVDWWNKIIEELRAEKPKEKTVEVINGEDLIQYIVQNKGGAKKVERPGPWVAVVMNCLRTDVEQGLVTKTKEDALRAGLKYYEGLQIYAKAQWQLLPEDKQTERAETEIWLALKSIDAREKLAMIDQ